MKKNLLFYGAATALVTPFSNGVIDYDAFGRLIDFQIESGINALVVGGTTGEAATLSDSERYALFNFSAEAVNRRVPLIFGTGTNDTKKAIEHTKVAERLGADGALVVTPYYNKGTREGTVKHYSLIAECTDLPIILYNVPSRTGVDLSLETLDELCKIPNIAGIKEASDSAERLVSLAAFGDSLPLYSGNDSSTYTALALGGAGVISVISNFLPSLMSGICKSFKTENYTASLAMQLKLLPLIKAIFAETNPTPIKYIMSKEWKGFDSPILPREIRLPLSEASEKTKELLSAEILKLSENIQ